jgi:hypothetical protein
VSSANACWYTWKACAPIGESIVVDVDAGGAEVDVPGLTEPRVVVAVVAVVGAA